MQAQSAYRTQQLYARGRSAPKYRVNSQFVHFVDQHHEIVTEHFAQRLVNHRNVRLAPQPVSEFPFDHAERGFNIAALMVVLQELCALELEVVIHPAPYSSAVSTVMGCEGDKRNGSRLGNRFCVVPSTVASVRRNFVHLKILGGGLYHWGEQLVVIRVPVSNLDSRHDVGFDTAHQVALNPIMLFSDGSVFVVIPANETRGSETGRVYCEVRLDRLQGQAALGDEFLQDWGQVGILKVVENRIVVGRFGDETVRFGSPKITHKTASRNGGIYLERRAENCIGQRQAGASHLVFLRSVNAPAEISEQSLEFVLFVGLRCVVRGPVLRVGCALGGCRDRQSLRHGGAAIGIMFACHSVRDRKNMLAADAARLEIRASATLDFRHYVYPIRTIASLRRDNPQISFVADRPSGCDFETALLSGVHDLRSLNPVQHPTTQYITSRYIVCQGVFVKKL